MKNKKYLLGGLLLLGIGFAAVSTTLYINGNVGITTKGEAVSAGFIPTYFAYGKPTTASTTDFTTLGKNVFAGLGSDGTTGGVCINDGGLFCIKTNDYDNSVEALKAHFGESSCPDIGSDFSCLSGDFYCRASSNGTVYCSDDSTNGYCGAHADGYFYCR